jgi:hypothetical protein
MAILPPSYVEDIIYASYIDRLLIKSLGVQAGVVEENDYKVSAGSGLQVEAEKGKAFVAETGAIEESSNSFFNGLYNVLSSTKSSPYNNVVVSAVNPQIAQIILRVYDVGELKISGQSYARLEWLNGSPNAGATKAHIEEGKSSEYGAAVLSQSSLRLCYIVVPKNATKSSEYTIVDERTNSTEVFKLGPEAVETSNIKKEAVTTNAVKAEAITALLIAAGAVGDLKIVTGRALVATGGSYSAIKTTASGEEQLSSATRLAFVSFSAAGATSAQIAVAIEVGGTNIGTLKSTTGTESPTGVSLSFLVPPGVKWLAKTVSGAPTMGYSQILL